MKLMTIKEFAKYMQPDWLVKCRKANTLQAVTATAGELASGAHELSGKIICDSYGMDADYLTIIYR